MERIDQIRSKYSSPDKNISSDVDRLKNKFQTLSPAQSSILKAKSTAFKTKFSEFDFKLNPKHSELDFGFVKNHQEISPR